jgi:hypothetical protein
MERYEDQPGAGSQGWLGRVGMSWYVLAAFGLLLYELTAQPGLGAAVACAKAGWEDWRSAFWLRRVDPDWRRGRTCFWFYLAYGLWKVALLATLMMIVLMTIAGLAGRPAAAGGGLSPAVKGVLVAAGLGFGLSFFLTYLALGLALRHRVRVWLGAAPHRARRQKYWPPEAGSQNLAPFVIITTVILTLWVILVLLALGGAVVAGGRGSALLGLAILGFLGVASPATMFVLKYLDDRVFARAPGDCWPPDEFGSVVQADERSAALCDD